MPAEQLQLATDYLDTRQLLEVLVAVKKGDFSVRMPLDKTGVAGKIADTLNDIIELQQRVVQEYERISVAVGKQGKITERASVMGSTGDWAAGVAAINVLIGDLIQPTNEMARVIGAVAKGDLTQTMAVDIEGKLGGQALVKGLAGTWRDLTDSVNSMAGNLTAQVRNIADVTTAVANGDLSKKIAVDVKGEFLELKNTINTMVDQLRSFASEVTRVAREVGTEGKLGGQARVEGVSGTWKDLTDNVNSMAGNLTAQVRNIAAVTTAVANGDLSKKITVDVKGEIL